MFIPDLLTKAIDATALPASSKGLIAIEMSS